MEPKSDSNGHSEPEDFIRARVRSDLQSGIAKPITRFPLSPTDTCISAMRNPYALISVLPKSSAESATFALTIPILQKKTEGMKRP